MSTVLRRRFPSTAIRYPSVSYRHHTYSHQWSMRSFCKPASSKKTKQSKLKKAAQTNSRLQWILERGSNVLMLSVTACVFYFVYRFQREWVEPRQMALQQWDLPIDVEARDKAIKHMAKMLQPEMQFVTADNTAVSGADIVQHGDTFFIVYLGYPGCKDRCDEIVKLIGDSITNSRKLEKSKDSLAVLFIDINIYDTAKKLNEYLSTHLSHCEKVIGLIPKDRESLREIMETFHVFIHKHGGSEQDLQLHHSNMIYFVDCDGLLYHVLGGSEELNEQQIVDTACRLLRQSDSTLLGRIRNTLSLMFQTQEIRQISDYVEGERMTH